MTDQTPVPPPPPPPPPPPAPSPAPAPSSSGRGRKKAVIGGIVAAVVLGGSYGAYAVYDRLDGGGPQPHDVLPSSTDAYLRVDLDPSASQKVDLFRLVREFPELADELGITSDRSDIRQLVFGNAVSGGCDNVDYADDVEPWLGDRIGVGVGIDEKRFVVAVQTTDESASRAGIKKLFACADESYGIGYLDGYAILAAKQSDVDAAIAETGQGTLGDKKDFVTDFDQLGNQGIASGWADLRAIAKIPEIAEAAGPQATQLAKAGTVATTLRVDGSAIELAVLGGLQQAGSQQATDLSKLPADTVAALSFSGLGEAVTQGFDSFTDQITAPSPVAPVEPDGTPDPDLDGLDGGFGLDEQQELPPLLPPEVSGAQSLIDEIERATGFRLPEDLATLFGDSLTLTIGSRNLETLPTLSGPEGLSALDVAVSLTSDRGAALDLVQRIAQFAGEGGVPLVAAPTDDGAVLATNQRAADAITDPSGTLGDDPVFRSVIPSGDTAGGLFVNVGAILDKLLEADPPEDVRSVIEQAKAVAAVGVSVSEQDDDRSLTTLRIGFAE